MQSVETLEEFVRQPAVALRLLAWGLQCVSASVVRDGVCVVCAFVALHSSRFFRVADWDALGGVW